VSGTIKKSAGATSLSIARTPTVGPRSSDWSSSLLGRMSLSWPSLVSPSIIGLEEGSICSCNSVWSASLLGRMSVSSPSSLGLGVGSLSGSSPSSLVAGLVGLGLERNWASPCSQQRNDLISDRKETQEGGVSFVTYL
jgi:hypothetical protein